MNDDNQQNKDIVNRLLGLVCQRVRLAQDVALILYLGDIVRQDTLKTEWRLWLSSAWRITTGKKILVGAFDEPGRVLPIIRSLQGEHVTALTLDADLGDLQLTFSNDLTLTAFPYSWEDEHWQVRHTSGLRVTFGPDARLYSHHELPDKPEAPNA